MCSWNINSVHQWQDTDPLYVVAVSDGCEFVGQLGCMSRWRAAHLLAIFMLAYTGVTPHRPGPTQAWSSTLLAHPAAKRKKETLCLCLCLSPALTLAWSAVLCDLRGTRTEEPSDHIIIITYRINNLRPLSFSPHPSSPTPFLLTFTPSVPLPRSSPTLPPH